MSSTASLRPRLVIISGPSGAGKSTVVRELLDECPLPLVLSVSATTRTPRRGEVEGEDYFFLTPEQFAMRRAAGEFLECKEYASNWYGTLQSQVTTGLAAGKWVLLEIDVEGTLAVLEQEPEALTIFVHSGSIEELERRLRARNTESEEALARRLSTARRELAQKHRYRYEVINRDVRQAVREVCDILLQNAKE
jgi:guanylate kinase